MQNLLHLNRIDQLSIFLARVIAWDYYAGVLAVSLVPRKAHLT